MKELALKCMWSSIVKVLVKQNGPFHLVYIYELWVIYWVILVWVPKRYDTTEMHLLISNVDQAACLFLNVPSYLMLPWGGGGVAWSILNISMLNYT